MTGEFIAELDSRIHEPKKIDTFIVRPNNWTVEDPAALVKPGPLAAKLDVYTLGAMVEYVNANRDSLLLEKCIVHAVSPSIVTLNGPLQERSRVRETYVQAKALDLTDGFTGKWLSLEEFIIGLQSRFLETEDRQAVLALVSNITHATVKVSTDDGKSQTVEAKQGIVRKGDVTVPTIVKLSPFRTFREVPQPVSSFVLRVNGNSGSGLPSVGLFEADGGAWRLEAVESIVAYVSKRLGGLVAILG